MCIRDSSYSARISGSRRSSARTPPTGSVAVEGTNEPTEEQVLVHQATLDQCVGWVVHRAQRQRKLQPDDLHHAGGEQRSEPPLQRSSQAGRGTLGEHAVVAEAATHAQRPPAVFWVRILLPPPACAAVAQRRRRHVVREISRSRDGQSREGPQYPPSTSRPLPPAQPGESPRRTADTRSERIVRSQNEATSIPSSRTPCRGSCAFPKGPLAKRCGIALRH